MTPEQRQQIRDLIAAGEKAQDGNWFMNDIGLNIYSDYGGEKGAVKIFDIRGWGHLNAIMKLSPEDSETLQRANGSFTTQAANAREAIEAMEKENERLRDVLKKAADWMDAIEKDGVLYDGKMDIEKCISTKNTAPEILTNETKESGDE